MVITNPTANPPLYINMKEGINYQEDYVQFVAQCVAAGVLVRGDVLVCDNAQIHYAYDTYMVRPLKHGMARTWSG